jgi:hypothetical protein
MKFHTDDPLILDTTAKISRHGDLTTGIYAHLVQRIIHFVVSYDRSITSSKANSPQSVM